MNALFGEEELHQEMPDDQDEEPEGQKPEPKDQDEIVPQDQESEEQDEQIPQDLLTMFPAWGGGAVIANPPCIFLVYIGSLLLINWVCPTQRDFIAHVCLFVCMF